MLLETDKEYLAIVHDTTKGVRIRLYPDKESREEDWKSMRERTIYRMLGMDMCTIKITELENRI